MSLDLDFIRKLILVSKNDLFQINKELKDLKIIIKEELNELKELKKTVVKKKSKGYIDTIVKKESVKDIIYKFKDIIYKFSLECFKLKVLKNGERDGRKLLAKQDQNFMFQVF